jgi:DNA-directed RNA polymerase subunit P
LALLDWDEIANILYECARCGHRFLGQEMKDRDRIVCPVCGYHVLKKVKPPVVKRLKAI